MYRKYIINIIYSIPVLLIIAIIIYSCQHESIGKNEYRKIIFESEVLPIIQNNCTASGCHNGTGEAFALTNYDQIIKEVSKGDASSSKLFRAITSIYGDLMPPDKPLTAKQRAIIKLWIDQGAENIKDTTTNPIDSIAYNACFTRDIYPIIQSGCVATGCHNDASKAGNISLTSYDNIVKVVSVQNPSSSELYLAIIKNGQGRMPPSPRIKLVQSNIDSIFNWIKAGAKNETCASICDTTKFSFSNDIFPIFESSCISCHNSSYSSFGVKLDNYSNIYSRRGDLIGVINSTGSSPQMPPNYKLSDCNIKKIEKWVNAGSKND